MVNTRTKNSMSPAKPGAMSLRSRGVPVRLLRHDIGQSHDDENHDEHDNEEQNLTSDDAQIKDEDNDATDNDTDSSKHSGFTDRLSTLRNAKVLESDEDDEDFDPTQQEKDNSPRHIIRKSCRSRRPIYDSLNSNVLSKSLEASQDLGSAKMESKYQTRHSRRQAEREHHSVSDEDVDEDREDMYSRIKRHRILRRKAKLEKEQRELKANNEEMDEDNEDEEEEDDEDEDDDDESESDKEEGLKSYNLRGNRKPVERFSVTQDEKRSRTRIRLSEERTPPTRSAKYDRKVYRSPAHRMRTNIRKKAAFHGSSSTSSSDDDEHFEKRKAKSMIHARNRCLPMNLAENDVASGHIRDRVKIGSSLADVDPMTIDRSVTFESVGGLGKHLRSLKEMVIFPLLYPEVFEKFQISPPRGVLFYGPPDNEERLKFQISPPRGVLFYGPPGTGKTLVARALANESSHGDTRVAFFMRKGADCLSKWVGESERQLRLLFDQAYQMRPSIIFFDEIDGLAPVRSSRQDQIHSSIVSTLLALMDGLDSRGEIVVIGATNRIDSIDPALRRPGRFDREFLFPLPSLQARTQILSIHTKAWNPKLSEVFINELAERCVGYCGADLKALCTEAALVAMRRRYPQIYTSSEKLQLNLDTISMSRGDFLAAMATIIPTAQRSVVSPAHSLSARVAPLLQEQLAAALGMLNVLYPTAVTHGANVCEIQEDKLTLNDSDNDDSIYDHASDSDKQSRSLKWSVFEHPPTHRPRLLLSGVQGQGHTTHIAPALLHNLERLPVHLLDLPTLFGVAAKTPEESCSQVFQEARRTSPSIIFMPHIDQWWDVLSDTLRTTFLSLIHGVAPSSPLLLLATSDVSYEQTDETIQQLFDEPSGEVFAMTNPSEASRREFFEPLIVTQAASVPPSKKKAAMRVLEILPKAPPPKPRELTDTELTKLRTHENETMRELRIFLRDVLTKILNDKKLALFSKPVMIDDVPDYHEIITNPMDLGTMMSKIDKHAYMSVKEFLADIDLICSNALEYNPDMDSSGRIIRHRACSLRDTAHSIIKSDLDPDFEKICLEVTESMKKRGETSTKNAPAHVFTLPAGKHLYGAYSNVIADCPDGERYSRRVRGMEIEPEAEDRGADDAVVDPVDKKRGRHNDESVDSEETVITGNGSVRSDDANLNNPKLGVKRKFDDRMNDDSAKKKKTKGCIWAKPRKRRRRSWTNAMVKRMQEGRQKRKSDLQDITEKSGSDPSPCDRVTTSQTVTDQTELVAGQIEPDILSSNIDSDYKTVSNNTSPLKTVNSPMKTVSMNTSPSPDKTIVNDSMSVNITPKSKTKATEISSSEYTLADIVKRRHSSPLSHKTQPLSVITDDRVINGPKSYSPTKHTSRNLDRSVFSAELDTATDAKRSSQRLSKSPARYTPPCLSPRGENAQRPENAGHENPQRPNVPMIVEKVAPILSLSKALGQGHSGISSLSKTIAETEKSQGDSGISSSLDSNGDSRDSIDHAPPIQIAPVETMDVDPDHIASESAKPSTSSGKSSMTYHMTRHRSQNTEMRKAIEILETPEPTLVVDHARLSRLLATVVDRTHGYTVERLEKLHSNLGRLVYAHYTDYDKTQLITKMEEAVGRFTQTSHHRMENR